MTPIVDPRVQQILAQEVPTPWPDVNTRARAFAVVEELLVRPRESWPVPTSSWDRLVVGLAVSVKRVEGGLAIPRGRALTHVALAFSGEAPRLMRIW